MRRMRQHGGDTLTHQLSTCMVIVTIPFTFTFHCHIFIFVDITRHQENLPAAVCDVILSLGARVLRSVHVTRQINCRVFFFSFVCDAASRLDDGRSTSTINVSL